MHLRDKNGFTLIEILIVVTILGIAATMLTLTYMNIQKEARDSKRHASAVNLAESLERYFARTGEYPPVTTVTNPNAQIVKQTLNVATINSLLSPNAPAGSNVNAWKNGTTSVTNQLTYTPNTDTSPNCATGTASTDSCIDYKLQYYKEKTDAIETIYSRNRATAVIPTAPTAPTVIAELNGSNAVATASGTSCASGMTIQYAFSTRTNDGTWSTFSAWSVNATTSTPVTQGVKYGFQAKSNCTNGTTTSAESAVSSEATYTHPINAPAAPVVAQSTSGTTTTFSINTISCPAGTTGQVQYHLTTDWGYNGAWTTPGPNNTVHNINTANEGYEYEDEAQVRCTNGFATSDWSVSGWSSYIRPVTTPGGATNYVGSMSADATRFTWSFTRPACHSSVSTGIYYNVYVDNGWVYNGVSGWTGWRGSIVTNTSSTLSVYITPDSGTFGSGGRSAITTEWYCINQTTGRQSAIGPRVQSATYTYNP